MKILQVNASARSEGAVSTRLAGEIVARLVLQGQRMVSFSGPLRAADVIQLH